MEGSLFPEEGHVPGEPGIWIIVFGDLAIFGAFFINFMIFRTRDPDGLSGHLSTTDQGFGAVNTVILLTSSLAVVMALDAIRHQRPVLASRLLLAAAACGVSFACLKVVEYREKFGAGISINTNKFYSYYFALTGLHLIHLVIGVGVLFWMRSRAKQVRQHSDIRFIESGAMFWHMVDLIWVILFPLLYLVKP